MEVRVHAAAAVQPPATDARRLAAVLVRAPLAHPGQVVLPDGVDRQTDRQTDRQADRSVLLINYLLFYICLSVRALLLCRRQN